MRMIRECKDLDVLLLDQVGPSRGATSFHAQRFERQQAGLSTYLVAWRDEQPIGSCELRWDGCAAPEVHTVHGDCPEINGLAVWPESMRSQGTGTALIHSAEDLARRRGTRQLGIGVEQANVRAADLYFRLGYSPRTVYIDRWSYDGRDGITHQVAAACVFMIKTL